jgi:hypothetical protein
MTGVATSRIDECILPVIGLGHTARRFTAWAVPQVQNVPAAFNNVSVQFLRKSPTSHDAMGDSVQDAHAVSLGLSAHPSSPATETQLSSVSSEDVDVDVHGSACDSPITASGKRYSVLGAPLDNQWPLRCVCGYRQRHRRTRKPLRRACALGSASERVMSRHVTAPPVCRSRTFRMFVLLYVRMGVRGQSMVGHVSTLNRCERDTEMNGTEHDARLTVRHASVPCASAVKIWRWT